MSDDNSRDQIIALLRKDVSQGEIVKQLGLTRHAVRSVAEWFDGYQTGRKKGIAEAASRAIHPSTGVYSGGKVPSAADSQFNEALLADLVSYLGENKAVPEKVLRDKHGVSGTMLYKYRAIAADRVQCGRVPS